MSGESQVAGWADELSIDISTLAAGYNLIGTLDFPPVHLIIDNQGDVPVEFSTNGTSTKKTFAAGQAIIFDMSANMGAANDFTFFKGLKLYVKDASGAGTGDFYVTYTYRIES